MSVFIGDKVWVGQNVTLLKGTKVYSGSILGASSVASNKKILSNSVVAGNPARTIKENVFWNGRCVHGFDDRTTTKYMICTTSENIFSYDENSYIPFEMLDKSFSDKIKALDKAERIKSELSDNVNRFAFK